MLENIVVGAQMFTRNTTDQRTEADNQTRDVQYRWKGNLFRSRKRFFVTGAVKIRDLVLVEIER